jgi:hypothetical protein
MQLCEDLVEQEAMRETQHQGNTLVYDLIGKVVSFCTDGGIRSRRIASASRRRVNRMLKQHRIAPEAPTRCDAVSASDWLAGAMPMLWGGIRCRRRRRSSPPSRLGRILKYFLVLSLSHSFWFNQFFTQLHASADSASRLARSSVISRPAALKHRSHSADIAGIDNASRASRDRLGHCPL